MEGDAAMVVAATMHGLSWNRRLRSFRLCTSRLAATRRQLAPVTGDLGSSRIGVLSPRPGEICHGCGSARGSRLEEEREKVVGGVVGGGCCLGWHDVVH